MTKKTKRQLKVFLCHSSTDKPFVRDLYQRLLADGIDVWLDEEKLIPGQWWESEIRKAVQNTDVVIICLSKKSVNKEGFVQKEITYALDMADEKPEGTIFLIPAKIEKCSVPARLSRWQWVNLFDDSGYEKLLQALHSRAVTVGAIAVSIGKNQKNRHNLSLEKKIETSSDELKYVYPPPRHWKEIEVFVDEDAWPYTSGDNVTHLYIEHWDLTEKFLWNIESRDGSGHWTKLGSILNPPTNFCLTVCGRKVFGKPNSEYGLLFGYADNDNFYDLQIADDKRYFIWHKVNGKYVLLKKGKTSLIHPNDLNNLAITAIGSQFYFFINQRCIWKIKDPPLLAGYFGPSLRYHEPGEKLSIEFSELKFYS